MKKTDCDKDCLSCNTDIYISCEKCINPNTRPENAHSSEPSHVKINNGSDSNAQFTEEPEAEVIEVVVLAIKSALRKGEI